MLHERFKSGAAYLLSVQYYPPLHNIRITACNKLDFALESREGA